MQTRISPKPNGTFNLYDYKHIYVTHHHSRQNKGTINIRINDANPSDWGDNTEKIFEEFKMLGITCEYLTYVSSYFELLMCYAEELVLRHIAYVDDNDMIKINALMRDKKESKNRNNTVKENMQLWRLMKTGTVNYVLRAKICMQHDSELMRDPILYWVNPALHFKTGDKFKIYPTDLFAVPLIDDVEQITHLCVNKKFSEHLQLYYWLLDVFKMKKPNVMMYSNVDFDYAVTVHQKTLVDEKYVENYDDPRLLTLNSLIRKGFSIRAILSSMEEYFIKNKPVILWDDLTAINRKFIDRNKLPKYNVVEKVGAKILLVEQQYYINDIVTEKEIVQLDKIGTVLITSVTDKYMIGEITSGTGKILKYVPVNNCMEVTVEKYDDILKTRELAFKDGKIDPNCINKESHSQKFYYGDDMSGCQVGALVDLGICVCRVDKINDSKINMIMIDL